MTSEEEIELRRQGKDPLFRRIHMVGEQSFCVSCETMDRYFQTLPVEVQENQLGMYIDDDDELPGIWMHFEVMTKKVRQYLDQAHGFIANEQCITFSPIRFDMMERFIRVVAIDSYDFAKPFDDNLDPWKLYGLGGDGDTDYSGTYLLAGINCLKIYYEDNIK